MRDQARMHLRLAALACLAACGTSGGGGNEVDTYTAAVLNAQCDIAIRCHLVDDFQTCVELGFANSLDPNVVAAVHAGLVGFDAAKARACLAGIEAWTCNRDVAFTTRWTPPECEEVVTGTVAGAGECALGAECVSSQCNVPGCAMACCSGSCVGGVAPVRQPRLGDSCVTRSDCYASFCLVCAGTGCPPTAGTCIPLQGSGGPCMGNLECVEGLVCANQQCQQPPALGEACTGQNCADLDSVCGSTSATCIARGATGAPCTSSAECTPVDSCGPAGTCVPRPRFGDPCSVSNDCIDASFCDPVGHTCIAPELDGLPCQVNRECQSGHCNLASQTCFTPAVCI